MRGRRRRGRGFRRLLRSLRRRPRAARVPLAGPPLDQLRNAHHVLEGGDREAAAEVEASAQPRPDLPAKCRQCGGTVRGDEVEWTAEGQAVCDYCGSQLQAGA